MMLTYVTQNPSTQIVHFTHVTVEYVDEDTVHEILFLFEEFMTISSVFRFVCPIYDFFTVMGCSSD